MLIRTFGLAAIAATMLTAPAAAAPSEAHSVAVPYDDLNLASDAGQVELDRRIDRAARQVCGMDREATGSRIRSPEARKCYREAKRMLEVHVAQAIENRAQG